MFAVGDGGAPSATVDELLAGADSGPVTSVAFAAARAVQFGAIALAIGALAFLLWAWLPALRAVGGATAELAGRVDGVRDAAAGAARRRRGRRRRERSRRDRAAGRDRRRDERVGGAGPDRLGRRALDALRPRVGARRVLAWMWLGTAALALGAPAAGLRPASVGATGLAAARPESRRRGAPGLPVAALALLPALGGHAAAEAPVAINLPANVLHVVAAGAWLGRDRRARRSSLRQATARLEAGDRTRLLAAGVGRFSTLAGLAVARDPGQRRRAEPARHRRALAAGGHRLRPRGADQARAAGRDRRPRLAQPLATPARSARGRRRRRGARRSRRRAAAHAARRAGDRDRGPRRHGRAGRLRAGGLGRRRAVLDRQGARRPPASS